MRIGLKIAATGLVVYLVLFTLLKGPVWADADTLVPPDDPTQDMRYWKSFVIAPDEDPLVAQSHVVFSVLLRAWGSSRLAPNLYVVASSSGPWAASLADGSILLTRSAIDTIMSFGSERAEHLLAFVLAHELAHQRSDDLWHLRFFRLLSNQQPETRKQIVKDLNLNARMLEDIAQKEAQADHDGLILMASVGYDPYQILDEKDFFTEWIENIWQGTCPSDSDDTAIALACVEARRRALRTRVQLSSVATQAMLYELGVQAFVAGRYTKARHYFTAYGRSYLNHAVLNAIGLTYFTEALDIQQKLIDLGARKVPVLYYPLLLDASVSAAPDVKEEIPLKRSAMASMIEQEQRMMRRKIGQAVEHFEKSIRLAPNHPKSYLMLACCYLLEGNTYMVRGIVQGKYVPRFGADGASDLILAMALAVEGHHTQAQDLFKQVIAGLDESHVPVSIPKDLLRYGAFYNSAALAVYLDQDAEAKRIWKELAGYAKTSGNGVLFQLALDQLNVGLPENPIPSKVSSVAGMRIGDRLASGQLEKTPHKANDFWLEGGQYSVLRFINGSRFVVGPDARIISAWQDSGRAGLFEAVSVGDTADRPIKILGIPDRRLHLISGEYLAYDDYGVAMHIDNNKVAGWFLYNNNP